MFYFNILEYIGLVALVIISKNLLEILNVYLIGPILNKVNFKSKGNWALVTGCTDGIGREYARQLARKGCDVILISRSMAKLRKTADEIEKEFAVKTKIIEVDFFEDNIYSKIEEEISGLEIGTLVNNVGVSNTYLEKFLDHPEWDKTVTMMEKINMQSVTRMTYLVLPQMLRRSKGVIINVASLTAIFPCPTVAVYSATKAYVRKFTENINAEYARNGIIIQCVTPGLVVTKMIGSGKTSLIAPSPKAYVKSALRLVGTASMTEGYFFHTIKKIILSLVSTELGIWLTLSNLKERENDKKELNKHS